MRKNPQDLSVSVYRMQPVNSVERGRRAARSHSGTARSGSGTGRRQRAPRERIVAAMVELVGEQGFSPTTVAHVIARAGASRRTFYELFHDRRACFLAACEEIVSRWSALVVPLDDDSEDQLETFVDRFAQLALAEPAALRALVVELPAAGQQGLELRRRLFAELGEALWRALGRDRQNGRGGSQQREGLLPSVLAAASARVLYARVLSGTRVRRPRGGASNGLVQGLSLWAKLYASQAEPQIQSSDEPPPIGGRAPGTLALSGGAEARRGLLRSESSVSRSFVVHHQRERLLDAVANLSARKGFDAVSIPEIVEDAYVSVQAFYEHFSSREDLLLVAFEVGHRKMSGLLELAYQAHDEPAAAAAAAVDALLCFYASEPSFARLALVEAPAAGAKLAATTNRGPEALAALLRRSNGDAPGAGGASATAALASACAVHELCSRWAAESRAAQMKAIAGVAEQLALTPLTGGSTRETASRPVRRKTARR
jgi:AcrR family transcriptional regulator